MDKDKYQIDEWTLQHFRVQDIVARTARVNLRDTVRVLRALAILYNVLGDEQGAESVNELLLHSATYGNMPGALHSKPDATAIDACDDLYELVEEEAGEVGLETIFNLSDDPYFTARVSGRKP